MVLNRYVFRILPPIAFKTVKNHRKEKQKSMILGFFFHFQFFETFGKLD